MFFSSAACLCLSCLPVQDLLTSIASRARATAGPHPGAAGSEAEGGGRGGATQLPSGEDLSQVLQDLTEDINDYVEHVYRHQQPQPQH